ncbi:NPR2 [Branchiostoma lanceolatum]|uniref:guanylate cyclase n=1 Tax=Branchiostoma lanceolatum TaxID=7740 RepID=A0A8J9ZMR2_BRALA|nr:NPR2 [Branchiostoma lanceolatum]
MEENGKKKVWSTSRVQDVFNSKIKEPSEVDAISKKSKSLKILRILGLVGVLILGMVIQNSIYLQEAQTEKAVGEKISDEIALSTQKGLIAVKVAAERGTTALYLSSGGDPTVYDRLIKMYEETDNALNALKKWPKVSRDSPSQFHSRENLQSYIRDNRKVLLANQTTFGQQIEFYTNINVFFLSHVGDLVSEGDSTRLWTTGVAYHMMLTCKDYIGLERAVGSVYYAKGGLSSEDEKRYHEARFRGQSYLDAAQWYSPQTVAIFDRDFQNTTLQNNIMRMREVILKNKKMAPAIEEGLKWFDNMTTYISIFHTVEKHIAEKIIQISDDQVQKSSTEVTVDIVVLVLVLVASLLITSGIYRMANDTQSFASRLNEQTEELHEERQRAEQLLCQIFPKSIAQDMTKNKAVPPKHFDMVTIMFSDIVGFARVSASLSSNQLIDLLNRLYHTFDSVIDQYDATKLDGAGGAYEVVSGLPKANDDQHAGEIASLALDFLSAAEVFDPVHVSCKIKLLIGINTGPCVAGVVGYKRPRYQVFGDTVTTAQSLETTSEGNKIQISSATNDELMLTGLYKTVPRTDTPKSMKGSKTFWLLSKTSSRMVTSHSSFAVSVNGK